jgi:hypothetical protein
MMKIQTKAEFFWRILIRSPRISNFARASLAAQETLEIRQLRLLRPLSGASNLKKKIKERENM